MQVQKSKVPPKPPGQVLKEARDAELGKKLAQERSQRRQKNLKVRKEILERAQKYESEYAAEVANETKLRRAAKTQGHIHVPGEAKLAFVIRIRGINKLNPKVIRIMRLLRLRQLHNGVFIRINKASSIMLRKVEPYITFGYPSRETIRKLIYKRGFAKLNKQRIPLTSNKVVESGLGAKGIICTEDVVNQIYTVGKNFKETNNFLWPFKLRAPRGGFSNKRHPFQRRGDWGNREHFINELIARML